MITSLLHQLTDIGNIANQISDWFIPFEFPQALVVGLLFVMVLVSYWRLNYYRQPAHDRLGDYIFSMSHINESFKATVWALHLDKEIDELIDGFEQFKLHEDKEAFIQIAALLDDNRSIAHAYLLRYLDYEVASRKSGWGLLLTNAPIEDGKYYVPRPSQKHLFSMPTKINMCAESLKTGFISDDAQPWIDPKGHAYGPCDHIYYSLQPIGSDIRPPQELRVNAQVLLSVAATKDQDMITLRESKKNKMIADAAERRANEADSDARRFKAQVNHERRQRVKKDYWTGQLTTIGTPLSLALIILVIGGCAAFLPDVFARNIPGYSQTHYIIASVLVGGLVVWAIGYFSNRNAGE